jgi:hypothetical protein
MCRLADYKERRLLISPKVLFSLQLKCIKSKLKQLGISHDALLTTSVGLGCANYTSADVIGALFAKVETKSNDGKKKVGKALVYVLKTGGNLLSCSTLKKLGLLPAGWPNKVTSGDTIYELNEVLKEGAVPIHAGGPSDITRKPLGQCDPDSALPCSCPRRQFTDPPDVLPMPATTVNRSKLEDWIRNYYASSAFNACKRQPMPRTAGPAMNIYTQPGAVPLVVHKPSLVPRIGDFERPRVSRLSSPGTWCPYTMDFLVTRTCL